MSNSIPYLAGEAVATAAIDIGAKDAADKQLRATHQASLAAILQALGKADFAGVAVQIQTLIGGITDPALGQLVADVWSSAQPFLQLNAQVLQNVPVFGGSVQQALGDFGGGVAAAAGAVLAQKAA